MSSASPFYPPKILTLTVEPEVRVPVVIVAEQEGV
jgi:hypothetical protein